MIVFTHVAIHDCVIKISVRIYHACIVGLCMHAIAV